VVAGADAGFAAYPLVDPDIIADMLSDGAVNGPNGALLGRCINGIATPQLPVYPGAPVNKLSVAGPTISVPSAAEPGVAGDAMSPASVINTEPLMPADAAASLLAGPMATLGADAAAKSGVVLSQQAGAPAVAVRVSHRAADELFAALAQGAVAADTLVPQDPVDEPALDQAMSVQGGPSAPPGADPGRLLWEDGERA
jgi:hypothetical protein